MRGLGFSSFDDSSSVPLMVQSKGNETVGSEEGGSLQWRGGAGQRVRRRTVFALTLGLPGCVCVFITGESESQNKEKQIWSYEERR